MVGIEGNQICSLACLVLSLTALAYSLSTAHEEEDTCHTLQIKVCNDAILAGMLIATVPEVLFQDWLWHIS